MAINFATGPAVNDTYTQGDRVWIWNGSGWAQHRNFGQVLMSFVPVSVLIELVVTELPGETIANGAWGLVNYV